MNPFVAAQGFLAFLTLVAIAILFFGNQAFDAIDAWRERRARERHIKREMAKAAKRAQEWP